jgi:hypothetical protein
LTAPAGLAERLRVCGGDLLDPFVDARGRRDVPATPGDLRQLGVRCATALVGNGVSLLADGARPMPLVPGIRTGGGTAFAGGAIELVEAQLEMTNPRRPRFV